MMQSSLYALVMALITLLLAWRHWGCWAVPWG